jgi:predicted dehydrogenase
VRVGVVGCGQHATAVLLPNLVNLGFELVATCGRRHWTAQAAADRFGAGAAYDDYARMMAASDLDAVIACVPPDVYGGVVCAGIAAGLPLFVEKPGAADAGEAASLSQLSADAGVPVMVAYMKRFAPAYRQARACVADPEFGEASLATFTFVMGDYEADFLTYLWDNPVHHFDLARFLLGELHDVRAVRRRSDSGRHAMTVTARTDADGLVTFQLGSVGSWYQHNESVEIFGVGSSVVVDNMDTCVRRPVEGPEQRWRPNYSIPIEENLTPTTMGFAPALVHFQAVVRDGVTCASDIASAAKTLAVVDAVLADLARSA